MRIKTAAFECVGIATVAMLCAVGYAEGGAAHAKAEPVIQEPGIPKPKGPMTHPHLYFTKADLPAIRERLKREPLKKYYDRLVQAGERALKSNSAFAKAVKWMKAVNGQRNRAGGKALKEASDSLYRICLVHLISGDQR